MDRAYASGAAGVPPAAPVAPSVGYPQAANPGLGAPATKPGPHWYYMITEEIRKVISDAGLVPDHATPTQLSAAISAMINASLPQTASIQGAFKNLQASATGTGATVTVSADEIAVESAANAYKTLRGVALSINSAAAGTNGLDTGALAASTWYSVWVIYNPTTQTVAGLLSLSETAPTLPAGYTHRARVGWIRTDGTANKYPLSFVQSGRKVNYKVASGSNVTGLPAMSSGVAGNPTTPTFVAIAVSAFVPPTAVKICFVSALKGGSQFAIVAPNNTYGAFGSTTNPCPVSYAGAASPNQHQQGQINEFAIESQNIYWASSCTDISLIMAYGWEDNL